MIFIVISAVENIGGSSFKTPRSKSFTNQTPSSNRQPLSSIQLNGSKRTSVYRRYSTVGKEHKENRPLNDKHWQRDVVRDLVYFCGINGYPNADLSHKDFYPISTNTFR